MNRANGQLTEAEQEVLQRGAEYQALKRAPGWARFVAYLEEQVAEALAAIEESKSADPAVTYALVLRWKERKALVAAAEIEVDGAVAEREEFVRQYLQSQRMDPHAIEDFMAKEELNA